MKLRSVALFGALVALAGCGGSKKPPAGPPPLAVETSQVQRRDISTSIRLDGQITPLQESTLSTPESGTIAEVLVNEGDRVTRGQLLAKLDTSQLEAQLTANLASVEQARAKLDSSSYLAPISSQQYSSSASQAGEALQASQNRITTAAAALRNAELVYNSDLALANQGYVSRTALEQAHASYIAAQQEVQNARQSLPASQSALQTAQLNRGQTRIDQATIAGNRAALSQAQANVTLIRTQIAQSAIYAPFDGVVTQRLLDPGAFAGPNQAIARVSQLSTVYVNANVPDEDLSYVRPGIAATFTSPSVPNKTFTGSILDVNPTPTTGTLSYRARIRQPNPGEVLRGGMLVTLSVIQASHRGAIVVPRTAVFTSNESTGVYTVVGGHAKFVPVTIGLQTDTLSEISGQGVVPGTPVIITRPDALQDGSAVAVNKP